MVKTNKEIFKEILELLKEKNLYPNLVDESIEANSTIEFKSYCWNVRGKLDIDCKNIFLDLYAEEISNGNTKRIHLGTFQSYRKDRQAFRAMAVLQADFIWEANEYIKNNLAEFPFC